MIQSKKSLILSLSLVGIMSVSSYLSTISSPDIAPVTEPTLAPISLEADTTNDTQPGQNHDGSSVVATNNTTIYSKVADYTPPSLSTSIADSSEAYKPVRSPYVREKVVDNTIVSDSNESYPLRSYRTQALPNDPAADQWWTSQTRLPELWDSATGSTETVLAIIDTGFALQHEEFQGRWYENSLEKGNTTLEAASQFNCTDRSLQLDKSCNLIDDDYDGIVDNESGATTLENPSQLNCSDQSIPLNKSCNMIDDDNNGLADDWRGWDFMNFDRSVQAGDIDPNGQGTQHASYVTGVAAANANNGVGIAGVNWQTKILPLQALGDNGTGTTISVARAIRYAIAQGADVINMSLGGIYPDSYTRQAIQEAIQAGVIVVAASGNDGCNCVNYPANYPEVVTVGAHDQDNNRAYFSSYGENIDIVAPGTQLYSTSWSPSNQTAAYAGGIAGTSLATPIVSGLLTLLVGQYPELNTDEIVSIMTENTNRATLNTTQVFSQYLGYGGLDSKAAFDRPLTPKSPIIRYAFSSPFTSDLKLHDCDATSYGSSKLYKVFKASDVRFVANPSDINSLEQLGYSKELITHACRSLTTDSPQSVRSINLFSEFDTFRK